VQSRRDLAASYFRIGNQLLDTEPARGVESLRKGFAIYVALATEQPASAEIQNDLAAAHNELGLALESWGDAGGALENHRKALSLREAFVAADPGNQRHRRNLSVSYVNLGRALVLNGDIKGGLESNRKGLAAREALFTENPHNADYRRLLAIAYQNDGDYRAFLHDVGGALQSFRKKLALEKQALADDPMNAQSRGDFAYSCERIGFMLAESRAYSQALSYLRQALTMQEKFSAGAGRDVNIPLREIIARAGVGEMQARLGNRALAVAESEKALSQLNATAQDLANSPQQSMRGQIYIRLARAQAALADSGNITPAEQREHWRSARNLYARSLEIWQDMQTRGILTGEDAAKPREVAREIARCEARLRK
jgi:tetratricopeptide (TPR) repeat protein